MTAIALIELVAFVVALGAVIGLAATRRASSSRTSYLMLLALLGFQAIIHLSDVAEWMGYLAMDQVGDNFRVVIPVLWMLAIFSLHREQMSFELDVEKGQVEFFLDESPLAICMFEEGGAVLGVSRQWAETFGMSRSEFVGKAFAAAPGVPQGLVDSVQATLGASGSEKECGNTVLVSWGGRREWVDWQARPSRTSQVGARRITLVVSLVTEKRERELQARRDAARLFEEHRVELVGQLAASVAHDLNNFLSVISVHAELLPEKGEDYDFSESRDAILTAAGSSTELVRSLNGIARARGPRTRIDLGLLLKSTVDLIHRTLPEAVEVQMDLPREKVFVRGDRSRLQQAVVNLLVNARDAMQKEGTLTIQLEKEEDFTVVRVADTGCGIPADIQERVFERFFTTKADSNGTGLGLALVKAVAQDHEGEVTLTSQEGKGTTVTLRVPVAPPPSA